MNNFTPPGANISGGPVWQPGCAPIAVVMISLNEAHNMDSVLDNLKGWAQEVFLVDSYSVDDTVGIALRHGAHVVQRAFRGFGDQWNFALRQLPIESPWTMKLDPDERLSDELKRELASAMSANDASGFAIERRLWFMGRRMPVRQSLLRVWRTGACRFSDVLVNEHPIVAGRIRRLHGAMEHHDSPNMEHWVDKQNKYSTAEALAEYRGDALSALPKLFGTALQRRMWVKRHFWKLPLRYEALFVYNYLLQGAWRAGWVGYAWSRLRSDVYRYREYKLKEIGITGALPLTVGQGASNPDPRVQQIPSDNCATEQQLPHIPKPAGIQFHDRLAAAWSEGYARESFSRRLDFIDRLLRPLVRPGTCWLDAGCGSGVLTRQLAALGATGDAVDGSADMIGAAYDRTKNNNANAPFSYYQIDTIERLELPDQRFDGVLCSSVIEYVDSPNVALGELVRVLKPGATLLVSVANRHSLVRLAQRTARTLLAPFRKDVFSYLEVSRATYSRREIAAVLRSCGIRIDSIRGFDPVLPAWTKWLFAPSLIFVVGTKERRTAR